MKSLVFAVLLLAGHAFAQEDKLIAILRSDAPLKEKADACQELARIGTRQAVPVLAALLADEALSVRARTALEVIDDPSVDAALRQAAGQLQGPLLVGVIHSLGVRRDPQAVEPLARCLAGADPAVAQAAARALGCLGGAAVPVLEAALSADAPATRAAVGEGLLRCAEALPASEAAALYDRLVALPDLPQHVRVAAWTGAVRSRGTRGVPLMLEALRTASPVQVAAAIRVSMELPGAAVTQALVGALAGADEEQRLLLLQTLGHRGDATAAPALVPLARAGSTVCRVTAIRSLVQLGDPSALPVLATLVQDPEPAVAGAAWTALAGWPGRAADATVTALLTTPDPKTRVAAIGAVGQRRITAAVPAILQAAGDADAGVAGAGFKVLGELAGLAEVPGLVDVLLRTRFVEAAEAALLAVGGRQADVAACTAKILPGLAKARGEPKLVLLRVLGSLGGPEALGAVRAATADPDPSVREAALRVVCDWPTADALADLAEIAKADVDPKFKQLALRGQLRLIPTQTLADAPKVSQIQRILPALERPEEQRLALAALAGIPCAESLALIQPYLTGGGLKPEASIAAVTVAEKIVAGHPAEVAEAMKAIQTDNAQLAQRVRQVLAQVPAEAAGAGFAPIFNGRDLTGWDGKPGWWKVEEGVLTAESTPDKPCEAAHYLIWRGGEPSDFELVAEFRLSGAGNSGIQLRSRALPNWDTSGYQADMSGDGSLVGFVYEHARGLIAGRGERITMGVDGKREVAVLGDAAELGKAYQQEAWNTYRIICRGPEITLYVNGTLMCQFTDRDPKHAASRGIIALQMHPGPPMKVEFRNIRLKKL